jgi:4-hydroxy-tetrahydrodipicolinate synthase
MQGLEPNPTTTKWALHRMGLIEAGIRLPLVPLSAASQAAVLDALRQSGALQQTGVTDRLAA